MRTVGARLVGEAIVFAQRVPLAPNEFRLLVYMALTALDADAKPRYFASRESSAFALGFAIPDEPAPGDPDAVKIERQRTNAFQRVKVATTGLVRRGAIASERRGREGQRAEYSLRLRPVENDDDR
ncbi:hypothetical protein [Curtobacterium sp. VKM Ac-1393]|uniref:hypothetical protein n=1 Tax=Curtobacterium sp. VKM Ac-1393 TaxID=2783814 RepID=UPI00188C25F0|nr:hypothetical protein [Curtobacterium sp. VKM Ac-1393]MBF4606936.1 hypothetical protein [Curtobacterium sp. VKM Ac-1393]